MIIEIIVIIKDETPKTRKLHPNYKLLKELSKRGILDDQLIKKMEFF